MAALSILSKLPSANPLVLAGLGAVVVGSLTVGVVVRQNQNDPIDASSLSPAALVQPSVPDARPGKPGVLSEELTTPEVGAEAGIALGDGSETASVTQPDGSRIVASIDPGNPSVSTDPAAKPEVTLDPIAKTTPPRFDLVRVDPKGGALVAGKAAPGVMVEITMDGVKIAEAQADRRGGFVAMFDMPTGETAHVLALIAIGPAGDRTPSADQVVVIGVPEAEDPPVAVATETEETPQETTAEVKPERKVVTPEKSPTILVTSDKGLRLLQPEKPAVQSPTASPAVTLDVITYDDSGEVVLSGRSDAEKHVRVYVDDAPIKTEKVLEDGSWQLSLSEVTAGRYTLRVDEIDPSGSVTSRVETPFQKEEASAVRDKVAALNAETETPASQPVPRKITVQPGTTLWALAAAKYGDGERYIQIFNANRDTIKNPDLIYPGQIFDIPD